MKFLIFFIIFLNASFAQDERFFRQKLLRKQKVLNQTKIKVEKAQLVALGTSYELDIDDDGFKELIAFSHVDGRDFIQIRNANGELAFRAAFETKGPKSRFFKLELRNLSPITRVLMIYYFEGVTNYLELINKGYVYLLSMDRKDFTSLAMKRGPKFWIERKQANDHYSQRKYEVNLFDFNKDGVKEVHAKFHEISQVFMYQGKGAWLKL